MLRNLLFIVAISAILIACEQKEEYPAPLELDKEKEKIVGVIERFNKANENKNFSEIVETLADEVVFFGTDSSEVIKTIGDFKNSIVKQWEEYESIKYHNLQDVKIFIDDKATLATIYFGLSADVTRNGIMQSYYLRGSRTLLKQNESWQIASGTLGIVRSKADEKEAYINEVTE